MISTTTGETDLRRRLGDRLHAKRLKRQHDKLTRFLHQGRGVFRLERLLPFDRFLSSLLSLTGLRRRMRAEFLDVRLEQREWVFAGLPSAFEGFRLLQLSDLHCDLDSALMPAVINLVRQVPHDAAVLTGDYRNGLEGDHAAATRSMADLRKILAPDCWGILGNHDPLEMVLELERGGLPVLLNEVAEIRRGGDALWIAGVDDPHYFQTHDLEATRRKAPGKAFVVLLAHSPETYAEAAALGFAFQLSGHTHGGQICLPGGRHVVVPCDVPRRFIAGPWSHGAMQGYTSRGTGGCGVAARLNCPPEVTLHTLRREREIKPGTGRQVFCPE